MLERQPGEKNWHSRSVTDVVSAFETDIDTGLTSTEASDRLQAFGLNVVQEQAQEPWWQALIRQFVSPLIAVLAAAVVISLVVDETTDAIVIALIVVLNGVLGFVQEWRAEHAIEALKAILAPRATVRRNSETIQIEAAELVPGDIVEIRTGMRVPADVRIITSVGVLADEAILTGESAATEKTPAAVDATTALPERTSMLHAGTLVTNGVGRGVAVHTGNQTEFGRIADLTQTVEKVPTPLQQELGHLGRAIGVVAVAIATLITIVGLAVGRDADQMLLTGISLAVAVVPEGLPAVVTVTLALGIRSMARQGALVRRLEAAEALGAATVVCTDKTGTLTTNEMTVRQVWTAEGTISVTGSGYDPRGATQAIDRNRQPSPRLLQELSATAVACNHASLANEEQGWLPIGEPTEAALLALAGRLGHPYDPPAATEEVPFSSVRKRMDIATDGPTGRWLHSKGAPDTILASCSHELVGETPVPITPERRAAILAEIDAMAADGMRTLALGRRELPPDVALQAADTEAGLTLLGAVGIVDPPRAEVPEAVRLAQTAGITVIMITGDAGPTALAIAKEIQLPAERAVLGPEIDIYSDADLLAALDGSAVFARTTPEQKLRIVRLLQADGEVVAMTGDGVNDSPALRRAEIGLAMGRRGTDAAKAASDLVLTDDNFATIIAAIREGRRQYANIRRFVRYLLSSNLGEVVAIAGNLLLGGPAILLPVQILWMNLVTDGATAVALGLEQAEPDLMEQPPRRPGAPILDRTSYLTVAVLGTTIGLGGLAVFEVARQAGASDGVAQTLAFTSIVVFEKVNVFNFRTDRIALHTIGWTTNRWLLVAWAATLGAQIAAVTVPGLRTALHTTALQPWHWLMLFSLAAPLLIGGELVKTVIRRRDQVSPAEPRPS